MSSKTCVHDYKKKWKDNNGFALAKIPNNPCPFCKEPKQARHTIGCAHRADMENCLVCKPKQEKQEKHSESEIKRYFPPQGFCMECELDGCSHTKYVLYSDYQETLTSQAKLYEGQIADRDNVIAELEKALVDLININEHREHFKRMDKLVPEISIEVWDEAKQALANLAEFRSKNEYK